MNGNTQVNPENKREIIESIGKDNKTKLTRFKYTIKDIIVKDIFTKDL